MYKTIVKFADLQDANKHVYEVGDKFPHNDTTISKSRIEELTSGSNKLGIPVIEEVKDNVDDDGNMPRVEELVQPKSDKVPRKVRNRKRDTDLS